MVIGHPGIWNNAMIYMSEQQTIVSQCPKQPLLNQLYKVLETIRVLNGEKSYFMKELLKYKLKAHVNCF